MKFVIGPSKQKIKTKRKPNNLNLLSERIRQMQKQANPNIPMAKPGTKNLVSSHLYPLTPTTKFKRKPKMKNKHP